MSGNEKIKLEKKTLETESESSRQESRPSPQPSPRLRFSPKRSSVEIFKFPDNLVSLGNEQWALEPPAPPPIASPEMEVLSDSEERKAVISPKKK